MLEVSPNNVVNVVKLDARTRNVKIVSFFKDYLSGAVELTENSDPDKYLYT